MENASDLKFSRHTSRIVANEGKNELWTWIPEVQFLISFKSILILSVIICLLFVPICLNLISLFYLLPTFHVFLYSSFLIILPGCYWITAEIEFPLMKTIFWSSNSPQTVGFQFINKPPWLRRTNVPLIPYPPAQKLYKLLYIQFYLLR